jgi:divalent metal cation (Fe/Co/Zn/Cd) transporter
MDFKPPKLATWVVCLVLFIVSVMIALDLIELKRMLRAYMKWIPIIGLGVMLAASVWKKL